MCQMVIPMWGSNSAFILLQYSFLSSLLLWPSRRQENAGGCGMIRMRVKISMTPSWAAICIRANGYMITSPTLCIKGFNVLSWTMGWLVRSLGERTLTIGIGGGNLMIVTFQAMLEKLRNKRLVFVGDSLNRNQWVSMVCLVESSIPPAFKSVQFNGSLVTFKATEYNATIDFYWAPLLVESNCDDPRLHRTSDRIVRIGEIEKHARHWNDADILVFNSYIWWRLLKLKALWGSFESPDGIYKEVEMLDAYEMALKTWSDWLDIHVNRTKTKLFFVSMSPTHNRAEEWGMATGQNCYNETEPITKEGYWGGDSDPRMMRIVEATINKLKTRGLKVQMLNITQLSEYRKEGHSSIHRKQWDPLTKEQLLNPRSYADCIHWCLPGVPDVWNELLYAHIFYY